LSINISVQFTPEICDRLHQSSLIASNDDGVLL
jgi:hypothetical protein